MEFQIYWPGWFHLIPWLHYCPANYEDGPAEIYFGWSIFQFRKYVKG